MIGARIGRFEVLSPLGSGGMGIVYRARDTLLGREVALKLIRPARARSDVYRRRFLEECRTAAGIQHPGIATVYEAGETPEGHLYFAAELVAGVTLESRLFEGPMPERDVVRLGGELAEALAAAHERGVVHRDIKPANIMITPAGRLKILDFGVAQVERADDSGAEEATVTATAASLIVGSPAYMSPEQAAGGDVDRRTDVFSAGLVLYEMVSGRRGYDGTTPSEVRRRIVTEEVMPLEEVAPGLSPELASIIRRALAKDPRQRFGSAELMAEALRALREGTLTTATGVAARAVRPRRAARWLLGAAGAGILALVLLLAWLARRPALAFQDRDTLLVAEVDNRTGDAAFDVALRAALVADLQQSRYANVFDERRVLETLRLMRRDPATRVDAEIGRDVCRYAGVRALLAPRIVKVGDAYDVQVALVDPHTGAAVDQVHATVESREAVLLEAVDEVSRQIRSRLGESLASIRDTDAPVARFTTSSWEAFQHLAHGQRKWTRGDFRDAADHFERALEEDPDFAAAEAGLGLLLIQWLDDAPRGRDLLRRAREDARQATERERLTIDAFCLQYVDGDLDGALRAFRVIGDLYPDLPDVHNNQGVILRQLGRYREALAAYEKAAATDPKNAFYLWNAYWLQLHQLRDPEGAERLARRMVAVDPQDASHRHMLAWSLVAQRRFEEAEAAVREVLALDPEHRFALPNLGHLLLRRGAAEEAVAIYRRVARRMEQDAESPGPLAMSLDIGLALEEAGRAEEADAVLAPAEDAAREEASRAGADPGRLLVQAELSAARGHAVAADALLRKAQAASRLGPHEIYRAATVCALLGRPEEALGRLAEAIAAGHDDLYFPLIAPAWRSLRDDPRLVAVIRGE